MGAVPVVGDVYDQAQLARQVAASKAEVVVHQLTAFGTPGSDPYAETIRVRIEGTRSRPAFPSWREGFERLYSPGA